MTTSSRMAELKKKYILRKGFGIQTNTANGGTQIIFAHDGPTEVSLTETEYKENEHKMEDPNPAQEKAKK